MELDYYLNLSLLSTDFIKDKWLYNASGATGSFTAAKTHYLTGSVNGDDFSLFFTFNKKNNSAGTIFGNYSGTYNSGSGFVAGFTENNEFFIDSHSNNVDSTYVFHNTILGNKNCLALVKNNKFFSLYKYDLYSSGIQSIESYQFKNGENLNGGTLKVGKLTNYSTNYGTSGVSGDFEQLLYVNTPLATPTISKIFSGFQPYSLTTGTGLTLLSSSEERRNLTEIYPTGTYYSGYKSFQTGILGELSGYFISNGLTEGSLFGYFSGIQYSNNNFTGQFIYGLSNTLCYTTGSLSTYNFSTSGSNYGYTGGNVNFSGSVGYLMNEYNEVNAGFIFGMTGSGAFGTNSGIFVHHDYYLKYATSPAVSLTVDTSYYNNFKMEGAVSNVPSGIMILATYSGVNPTGMNYKGIYDRTNGTFRLVDENDPEVVYYNGTLTTGYSLSGTTLDVIGVSETENDYVIYDLGSGVIQLFNGTLLGYATGEYYSNASIVFTGINAFNPLYRQKNTSYQETCSKHLAHSKQNQVPENTSGIYSNTDLYWNI